MILPSKFLNSGDAFRRRFAEPVGQVTASDLILQTPFDDMLFNQGSLRMKQVPRQYTVELLALQGVPVKETVTAPHTCSFHPSREMSNLLVGA